MFKKTIALSCSLILVLLFARSNLRAQSEQTPFVIHVLVEQNHCSVCFSVGRDSRLYHGNFNFYMMLSKMHSKAPNRPFLFLIGDDIPIKGIEGLFLIVDKYDLGEARYFVTSAQTGAMSEIKRYDSAGFSVAMSPAVPISGNPR